MEDDIDGPTRYADFDTGDTFDARKQMPGWDTTATSDASWANARTVAGPKGKLIAQKHELTENVRDVKGPFARWTISPGVYGFDVGTQLTGWATVKIWGATAGQVIRVVYVERRNNDAAHPRARRTARCSCRATCSSSTTSPTAPAPRPTRRPSRRSTTSAASSGCRSRAPTASRCPDSVKVDVDSVQVVHTALRPTGTFDSSSPMLNTSTAPSSARSSAITWPAT